MFLAILSLTLVMRGYLLGRQLIWLWRLKYNLLFCPPLLRSGSDKTMTSCEKSVWGTSRNLWVSIWDNCASVVYPWCWMLQIVHRLVQQTNNSVFKEEAYDLKICEHRCHYILLVIIHSIKAACEYSITATQILLLWFCTWFHAWSKVSKRMKSVHMQALIWIVLWLPSQA